MSRLTKLFFAGMLAFLGLLPSLTAQAQAQPAFELKMLSRGLVVDGATPEEPPPEPPQEPQVSASNWSLTGDLGRESWGGMTFGNGQFLSAGYAGNVYTSANGVNWTRSATAYPALREAKEAYFLNGRYFVLSVDAGNTRVMSSIDGTSWVGNALSPVSWFGMAYGNGVYVATGGSEVAYSADGVNFVRKVGNYGHYVAFGAGRFLAVPLEISGTLGTSTDGVNWSWVPNPLISTAAYNGQIAFVNGRFLLIQGATFATSTDGVTWSKGTLPMAVAGRSHITYGGGTYVIVSAGSKFLTSTDAVNWTVQNVPYAQWVGAAFGNGRFVGATVNGSQLGYSTN